MTVLLNLSQRHSAKFRPIVTSQQQLTQEQRNTVGPADTAQLFGDFDRRRGLRNLLRPTKILNIEPVGCCETSMDVYQTTRDPTSLFLNIKINPSLRLADTFRMGWACS